jgi:hypothetical protein
MNNRIPRLCRACRHGTSACATRAGDEAFAVGESAAHVAVMAGPLDRSVTSGG